jgi:hypothetical protein
MIRELIDYWHPGPTNYKKATITDEQNVIIWDCYLFKILDMPQGAIDYAFDRFVILCNYLDYRTTEFEREARRIIAETRLGVWNGRSIIPIRRLRKWVKGPTSKTRNNSGISRMVKRDQFRHNIDTYA